MSRALRVVLTAMLALGAIPIGLYSLFLVLYQGEDDGATYIKVGDGEIDAHLVGGVGLMLAATMLAAALLLRRRRL